MTPDECRDLIRRTMDELGNKGNLDVCDQLYAEHCSFHRPSFPINGVGGLRDLVSDLRTAQPDLHIDVHDIHDVHDVHDILVEGDMTAIRYTMAGTARGEFRGLPGTCKSYVMPGITIAKWDEGRVVEDWNSYDMLEALQQIGLVPELAQPGPQ
ncbi:ester cyclase [Hoyosella sp. YIM 151337]|uniref:ester cyclase n=1 Tax=Hoyosella sp. YIM 151337 TaxID=2992742 RepID=UPI002235CB3B|nr:ester cyclase [Hoyosella sp. YIM 151337]MCW4353861.1 ester cyclase [Hoyosella sp. YIM 151337]